MSSRHSSYPLQSDEVAAKTRQFEPHRAGLHAGDPGPLSGDKAEELAEKMIAVGGDYMAAKNEGRYGADAAPTGPGGLLTQDPEAVTNKIIKEAAREMERAERNVHKGGDAALAQKVAAHRADPQAPEHVVKEKILERVAATEAHAAHHTFVGPNPDKGLEHHKKERHMVKGAHWHEYAHGEITGTARDDPEPDVVPPRHVPRTRDEQPKAS